MMKVDLVLEGGGILGVAFIGAYQALEEKGYQVNEIAGSSAGSLMAALIQSGYTAKELIKIIEEVDLNIFKTSTKLSKFLYPGKMVSLFKNKGIYTNHAIKPWLDNLLFQKGGLTFENNERLKIIASDITNRRVMVIPDCLPSYEIDPDQFSVSDAVLMSTAIPYYYVPLVLKKENKQIYVVDGGLYSNFPVWLFDGPQEPKWPTFGIKIKDNISYSLSNEKNLSFFKFTKDIISAIISKDETVYLQQKDIIRTILIDHNDQIKTTDFNLNQDQIHYLINCGYESTLEFLNHFDFKRYCRMRHPNNKE
jgi:NTE family protein